MPDVSNTPHHVVLDELSQVLCTHTGRDAAPFFRTVSMYYMTTVASCMRARVNSPVFQEVPINSYVIALAPSGFGKGKATTGLLEKHVFAPFRKSFRDYIFPMRADAHMAQMASKIAAVKGTTEDAELEKLKKDFATCGEYPFVFDGGSESAIKQVRDMLLLADCGSINLQIDEIGTNLEKPGTTEAMAVYLELYDQGTIKKKLLKNTSDNKRTKELEGSTPTNMLLFGEPSVLFDNGPTEKRFSTLLGTGYARRCLFAWADMSSYLDLQTDVDVLYDQLTDQSLAVTIQKWADHFETLSDPSKLYWTVETTEAVDKLILSYKIECETKGRKMSEFDNVRKAELEHRYFRVIKVAGTLAFVEEALTMTLDHVRAAIKLVEESGQAFQKMLTREPNYEKLARYLASVGREVTHVELLEALPFYRNTPKSGQADMLSSASSYGYRNHIVVKKQYVDGIELFSADALRETDLDAVNLSYSEEFSHGYEPAVAPFDQLCQLINQPDLHWSSHAFLEGHRTKANAIPGFDLLIFDVDGDTSLQTVHNLLEDYVFLTHTTKRHTPDNHRFRLILPMSYELKLDEEDYQTFYDNLVDWLPFPVDRSAKDRSRKWATHPGTTWHYNLGDDKRLVNVLPFVPKTKKNEDYRQELQQLGSLDALERWFAQRWADGSRNNHMLRFAMTLTDTGMSYPEVEARVLAFNNKLSNGLPVEELRRTVLTTVARKLSVA